jgi:hypothetical protein
MLLPDSEINDYRADFWLLGPLKVEEDVVRLDILVPNGIWLLAVKIFQGT